MVDFAACFVCAFAIVLITGAIKGKRRAVLPGEYMILIENRVRVVDGTFPLRCLSLCSIVFHSIVFHCVPSSTY